MTDKEIELLKKTLRDHMVEGIDITFRTMSLAVIREEPIGSMGMIHLQCHKVVQSSFDAFVKSRQERAYESKCRTIS